MVQKLMGRAVWEQYPRLGPILPLLLKKHRILYGGRVDPLYSGPSYNFLAKILGVDSPLFIFNTEFYFPLSLLLVHKSHKGSCTYAVCDSSVGSVFVYCVSGWGSKPNEVIF
jgi:hypothetical protein